MWVDEELKSAWREVAELAWPIVVSMLSFTAMGLVDTLWVSRLGTGPLAAVGLGNVAVWLPLSFGAGLLTGTKVCISQRVGAGDAVAARRLAWQGLWLAGALGALTAIGSLGAAPLLSVLGAEPVWQADATAYANLRLLSAPAFYATAALNGWFHGTGAPRTAMTATILGNVVNIVLDPLFIFGWGWVPAMGCAGAGFATSFGFATSAAWMLAFAWPALRPAPAGLHLPHLRETWTMGLPAAGRGVLEVGSYLVFGAILAAVGEVALAAHVLVVRIASVSFLPGHAVGEAATVLVGQAVGARDGRRARRMWQASVSLAMVLMGSFAVLFVVAPHLLLLPFHPDAELAREGARLLRLASAIQLFDAVVMVGLGALNGAGNTRFVMRLSVAAAWLIKLPVGYLLALPLGLGAAGAWMGMTAEIIVVGAIVVVRLRGDRWLSSAPVAAERELVVAPAT